MGTDNKPIINLKRGTAVLLGSILAIGIIFAAVNSLAASTAAGNALASGSEQQVITSTRTLGDYLNAHTISLGSYDEQGRFVAFRNIVSPNGTSDVEWSGSTMQQGNPGKTVTYTLTLHNNTGIEDTYNIVSSTLWPVTLSDNVVTITANSDIEILAAVDIPTNTSNFETTLTVLTATAQSDADFASVTLTTTADFYDRYLTYVSTHVPTPNLMATRPNSQNDWQLQWPAVDDADGYEIQESQNPTFATVLNTYNLGSGATSHLINVHQPSPNNVYYYRSRTIIGNQSSTWSNVVQVNGAYYDEFDNNTTGWSRRRVTNIDQTTTFYEIEPQNNKDWLIVQSLDSWDWVIASPLKPAPQPPYVIEYRIKHANLGNLVSHGFVFGGDWGGGLCPDPSTVQGWYQHTACFNHFYDTNTIWFADLKLLFERVDQLVWCPNCGGSPMKRLGDIEGNPNNVPLLNNVNPDDWNTFRIEVRPNSIKFFANGALQSIVDGSQEYTDTRYINSPYFGIIATTDEYSNSTARVEYVKITPLDN